MSIHCVTLLYNIKIIVALLMLLQICACDYHLRAEPPLHRAAYTGDIQKMQELIKAGENIDGLNSEGATPLHWAAFKGQLQAAEILLRYGANVNAKTKKGSTPLRLATTHKKEALVRLLKRHGGVAE